MNNYNTKSWAGIIDPIILMYSFNRFHLNTGMHAYTHMLLPCSVAIMYQQTNHF